LLYQFHIEIVIFHHNQIVKLYIELTVHMLALKMAGGKSLNEMETVGSVFAAHRCATLSLWHEGSQYGVSDLYNTDPKFVGFHFENLSSRFGIGMTL